MYYRALLHGRHLSYIGRNPFRTGGPKGYPARHNSGSVFFKRKHFNFPQHTKRLCRRISGMPSTRFTTPNRVRYAHLPGDVHRRPQEDYTFEPRSDSVIATWAPRDRLQLHKLRRNQLFVCFHCGYPIKSALVAVKEENWDYRMCYTCYTYACKEKLTKVI